MLFRSNAASDPEKQFYTLKKKFEGGEKSPEFLKNFAGACMDAQETALVDPVANAYLATQKDWLTKENMDFILKFGSAFDSPIFAFVMKNQAAFEKEKGKMYVSSFIDQTVTNGIGNAAFDRQTRTFDFKKVKELGSKYLSADMTDKLVSNLGLAELQMKGEIPQLLTATMTHLDKYSSDNAQELNQYAWLFFENSDDKAQLAKALTWSLKSVELEDVSAFNDTAASLYFKLGDKQKAKQFAEKAIAQAKKEGGDPKETEALLKKIEAM